TFRSLLGIARHACALTYEDLYSGEWKHPTTYSGVGS
ncbi:MAG: IS1595 family transposase, partial [Candidatus Nitrotoga sp.]